jgi:TPR repeat protein
MNLGAPEKLRNCLCFLIAVASSAALHAQTAPEAQPPHYVLQKDYDDLRRSAGKVKSDELPSLQQRANSGDVAAQLLLGMLYQQGCGVVQSDIKTALTWYHKAADQKNSIAENQIGVYYDAGSGRNKAQGLQWYRKAAEHGDAVAEHNLGEMLTETGKPQDLAEGLVWLRQAVDHGFSGSVDDIFDLYQAGKALPGKNHAENQKAGFDLLQTWANQGKDSAQMMLAIAYWRGLLGLGKHPAQAVEWMTKAAEKSADAEAYLGWFRTQETDVPERNEQAVQWYRKSAEHGSATGQALLASMYEEGLGVKKDLAEAAKWTQLAAEHGDTAARYHLAEMYESGRGVPKDKITALQWFILARWAGAPDFMKEIHPNGGAGGFAFYRHPDKKDYEEAERRATAWLEQHLCQ